ncbi:hypothetical protein ACOMHN_062492 [Nucella lapillus]
MDNFSDDDLAKKDNSTNSTHLSGITSMSEYQAAVIIWKVWAPCIILLGGFGNIATIFVMRRIKDHNSSQYAIFMALAVSDLVLLYNGVLREWVRHLINVDVRNVHALICKLHKWLMYSVATTSAWLVTCVTVQRTMAVLWPHRMRMVWTVRRTWIVIISLAFTAFTYHSHLLQGLRISRENKCDSGPGVYEYFYRNVFMWVDLCVSNIFPCVCLFTCDIILSLRLFKATSVTSMATHAISNVQSTHSNARRKIASRTTVMVLALSCTFLVLTVPVYVFYVIWYKDVHIHITKTPDMLARMKLASTVTHLLWYTNSAVNFFLYCLTGTKYRKEFLRWITCTEHSAASAASDGGKGKQQDGLRLS